MLLGHAQPGFTTYQPYSTALDPLPGSSTLAMFIYPCLEPDADCVDEVDKVGDGMDAESQPLSGELGKTVFSGKGSAEWGVPGDSTDGLGANMKLCN